MSKILTEKFKNIINNPANSKLLIDKFHRYCGHPVGLNLYNYPSLLYNKNDKFYKNQLVNNRLYYEHEKNRNTNMYNDLKMQLFLYDKPINSNIYLVNLDKYSRIKEYKIINHEVIYNNRKCILLMPVKKYQSNLTICLPLCRVNPLDADNDNS